MAEPDNELLQPGLVEAHAATHIFQRGRVGQIAQQQLGRVSGNQPDQDEHGYRHTQKCRQRHPHPGHDEAKHESRVSDWWPKTGRHATWFLIAGWSKTKAPLSAIATNK